MSHDKQHLPKVACLCQSFLSIIIIVTFIKKKESSAVITSVAPRGHSSVCICVRGRTQGGMYTYIDVRERKNVQWINFRSKASTSVCSTVHVLTCCHHLISHTLSHSVYVKDDIPILSTHRSLIVALVTLIDLCHPEIMVIFLVTQQLTFKFTIT